MSHRMISTRSVGRRRSARNARRGRRIGGAKLLERGEFSSFYFRIGNLTDAVFFFHSLLVWGAVILITALSYATGLRGDESGTASNSTIEKAFDAGPGGALSLFLTTVVLAPLLEETVFRGFM